MEAASGYVILSHLNGAQRERALAEWSRDSGRKPPRDLDIHLARIRRAGYEKRISYLVKGVMNISFPILDDRGSAVGALTVPYIQYTQPAKTIDQVVTLLHRAATEISLAIGAKLNQ
jgi:DNA-binding IclR family transcriptional regulator